MAAPTPIVRSTRFIPRATNKYVFVPVVADPSAGPTGAELGAGTDLTDEIFSVDGFTTSQSYAEASDIGHQFKGKLPAGADAADSTLTFNADKMGEDVRSVLVEGQSGYLVIALGGMATGAIGEVWEIYIGSVDTSKAADESAKVVVSCGVPSAPLKDYEIPAVA